MGPEDPDVVAQRAPSAWGEANPNGSKAQVAAYMQEAKFDGGVRTCWKRILVMLRTLPVLCFIDAMRVFLTFYRALAHPLLPAG